VKLIFQLRYIKVFGSLFIIIKNIILEMMRFLLIWVLEIMVFISFGILFMGQLPQFQNMQDATFFVIQGIWGQWNIWGYIGPGTVSNLQYLGVIY